MQYLLNAHGLNVAVDGAFGPGTKGVVQQFQDSAAQAVFQAWTGAPFYFLTCATF